MLSRLTDFDRTFDLLDEFRRQMDRVWDDFDDRWGGRGPATSAPRALFASSWPNVNVADTGANIVVTADVPGLAENVLEISLHDGVLTLSGERKTESPEGYVLQRRERASFRFSRSLSLPSKVDPERTTASVKDGVLTVTLAKAPEARPRQITVKAQG